MSERFRPAWWARSPHVQTLVAARAPAPKPALEHERFELPDGDMLQLSWGARPAPGEPLLVLLHGLEGDSESTYIRRMVAACVERGRAVVVHHHRGCGREPNRLPRGYHSGDTADIAVVLEALAERYPDSPLQAAGYSLGANVLVKYLGERGEGTPLSRAAAVCTPLDLGACADRLERGFSRLYQAVLLASLKQKALDKLARPELGPQLPFEAPEVKATRSFRQYDSLVVARLHGFRDADDYYTQASSMPYLPRVRTPLLVLHAADDPFMSPAVIPKAASIPEGVRYELWPEGGHVGFIEGGAPWRPRFFLERRLLRWMNDGR